jgi:hypothetical protein
MVEGDRTRDDERACVVMGFDIHAGAVIDGRDRRRVERLCRYLARPPIAQERLVEIVGGKLRYELKKAWRDGTRFVVFEPHELLARVCAMIPPPRFHMIRFHRVLAPADGSAIGFRRGRDAQKAVGVAFAGSKAVKANESEAFASTSAQEFAASSSWTS